MKWNDMLILISIFAVGIVLAQHLNVVSSESMEPLLHKGDIVIINYETDNIDVGDVVVYNATWFDHKPVIHRVINKQAVNGSYIYTLKGDNNQKEDPEIVYPKAVIAKVVKINHQMLILPKLGYISLWFHELIEYFFGQTILYYPS